MKVYEIFARWSMHSARASNESQKQCVWVDTVFPNMIQITFILYLQCFRWNRKIISIALLGNYMHETPSIDTLSAFNTLLQYLKNKHYARHNFTLYGMCDISYNETDSPGKNLYNFVQSKTKQEEYQNFRHHVSTVIELISIREIFGDGVSQMCLCKSVAWMRQYLC